LQSELRLSNWHGVTAGLAYTWSHTIDNSNEVFNAGAFNLVGLAYPQDPFNVAAGERANALLDFPNVASIFLLYDTPWYKGQNGWKGRLLGGWEINPVWRYNSGQPYTVIETRFIGPRAGNCDPTGTFSTLFSACNPFLSNPSAPIDTVGQCTSATAAGCGLIDFNSPTGAATTANAVHWIVNDANSDAFFGTPFGARRNLQRGDVVNNMNLALLKSLKVNERLTMQLKATLYNVTNSQYLGTPDNLVDDGAFNPATNLGSFGNTHFNANGGGQFNTVFDGVDRRRLELGAKIIF